MNERVMLFAGGLVSLILVLAFVVPGSPQQTEPTSRPTSEDRGSAGLAGAKAWLESRGVRTASLRVRYHGLDKAAPRRSGNLLILHLPRPRSSRPDENHALREWIKQGNTLVIVAAPDREPAWASLGRESVTGALQGLDLAIERHTRPSSDTDQAHGAARRLVHHPLTRGAEALALPSPRPSQLRPAPDSPPWLGLFGRKAEPLVWWRPHGDGAVFISAIPDLFGNDPLVREDNARLLANLVAVGLGDGGTVVFDDFHTGLSQLYDEAAFYSDPRLHASLLFIVGFWLLYVVGRSNRIAPPVDTPRRPSARDLIEGLAGLFARRCNRAGLGRRLMAYFFDDVRRHQGLPENGQAVWQTLEQLLPQQQHRIARLRRLHRRLESGGRVSLLRLTRDIEALQESLP